MKKSTVKWLLILSALFVFFLMYTSVNFFTNFRSIAFVEGAICTFFVYMAASGKKMISDLFWQDEEEEEVKKGPWVFVVAISFPFFYS